MSINIADAVNPFFFQLNTAPEKNPKPPYLITKGGQTTIYSALDEVYIADRYDVAEFATVVNDDDDLLIYGLDIVLACDLLHTNRGPLASRNISICCRRLTILDSTEKKGLTIDVSAHVDDQRDKHIEPDISVWLNNPSDKAENGDDIADALKKGGESAWQAWFTKNPGAGWAEPGAHGGTIAIACETLELRQKLVLKANGAPGNAGISGQSVKNRLDGAVGGNAGKGGRGGDSGTIRLTCCRVVNAKNEPLNLFEWVEVECAGGVPGDAGLPGAAYDSQGIAHYGGYAGSVPDGASHAAARVQPADLPDDDDDGAKTIVDASQIAVTFDLHFWGLLYHRAKLEYMINQPVRFQLPDANSPAWQELGKLIAWMYRLCYAYGDVGKEIRDRCIADVTADRAFADKSAVARALKLMRAWYTSGSTMWGGSVTGVPPIPFETLCGFVDKFFVQQVAVRDFYIKLRVQLANAIKSNRDLADMINAADYAVELHRGIVDSLKAHLFGTSDKNRLDSVSLIGELNAADVECNAGIDALAIKLKDLEPQVRNKCGIGVKDVLDSLKSMCFVLGSPKSFIGMGLVEGFGLYEKAVNNVTDDTGNSVTKAAVIDQIHQVQGGLDELSQVVHGMVDARQVGRLDQAILTSLDGIDKFMGRFTDALGDAAKKVQQEVDHLRDRVNRKNDVWLEYNDVIYRLAKEWEDYQAALAKKEKLVHSSQQELSANLVDAVQLYTSIYLNNLERSADLWAMLLRKYAYVTLDADLPDADYIGQISAFWDADQKSAQGIADAANKNWYAVKTTLAGDQSEFSLRYKLSRYYAGEQAIMLHAPPLDDRGNLKTDLKSIFYVRIDGSKQEDREFLSKLLSGTQVWLQIVPPAAFAGTYTDADGRTVKPPTFGSAVRVSPLNSGAHWDIRTTHVNPWIEGVQTDSGTVEFHIRLGPRAYIVDSGMPGIARYFGYNAKAVNTEFAHRTKAKVSDPTTADMAGGSEGAVSDGNVDKRGVFLPIALQLPLNDTNRGLRAAQGGIEAIKLQVHFGVWFRASTNKTACAERERVRLTVA